MIACTAAVTDVILFGVEVRGFGAALVAFVPDDVNEVATGAAELLDAVPLDARTRGFEPLLPPWACALSCRSNSASDETTSRVMMAAIVPSVRSVGGRGVTAEGIRPSVRRQGTLIN